MFKNIHLILTDFKTLYAVSLLENFSQIDEFNIVKTRLPYLKVSINNINKSHVGPINNKEASILRRNRLRVYVNYVYHIA